MTTDVQIGDSIDYSRGEALLIPAADAVGDGTDTAGETMLCDTASVATDEAGILQIGPAEPELSR